MGLNSPYFKKPKDYFEANKLALRDELLRARELSPGGIIGVNLMVAANDYEVLVRTACEHGTQFVVSGAGLPMKLPGYTADYPDVALVPIISSTRAARLILRKWEKSYNRLPDAFVVETPNAAGGHLGSGRDKVGSEEMSLEHVLPEMADFVKNEVGEEIPVIAAGGIWDRGDIDRMLALGADGVQMSTRFICTHECDAAEEYKLRHLKAEKDDIILVKSPVGLPGRAIRNEFTERYDRGEEVEKRCIVSCLAVCSCRDKQEDYCIVRVLDYAQRGDVVNGLIFAGSNAYRAEKIVSVREIMEELTA